MVSYTREIKIFMTLGDISLELRNINFKLRWWATCLSLLSEKNIKLIQRRAEGIISSVWGQRSKHCLTGQNLGDAMVEWLEGELAEQEVLR